MTVKNFQLLIEKKIREISDFPKEGIAYKDITPLLQCPSTSSIVIDAFAQHLSQLKVDAILGIESRGFLFGMMLANRMNVPFIPVRKAGKLPYHTVAKKYELEYGTATIEIHSDAIKKGWHVVVHDDLLATGGTANAAAELVKRLGGNVSAFLFLIELTYLFGRERIKDNADTVVSLIKY